MHRSSQILLSVLLLLGATQAATLADAPESSTLALWPRTLEAESGRRLVVHQPQIDRWEDGFLEARMAVVLHAGKGTEPLYGAVWISGTTRTNLDTRVVTVADIVVNEVRFPDPDSYSEARLENLVRALIPPGPEDFSLDRLLANVRRTRLQNRAGTPEIGPLVPDIFVGQAPARLVLIDGEPVLHPIPGTSLLHVVNTSWHILLESRSGDYFLRLGDGWVRSPDLLAGPWSRARRAPRDLDLIEDDHPRAGARGTQAHPEAPRPGIFVCTNPAELVVLRGSLRLSPIPGTDLLHALNTQSDLFFHARSGRYYLLAAGRWFGAAALDGPWALVGEDLPADFARIPAGHRRSGVLASVPGTAAAEEAVLLTLIPRRVVVERSTAHVTVVYDGLPNFRRIAGMRISYAVNSAYDVLYVEGRYYCCYQGLWFEASAPLGPWVVCENVPDLIYAIPPNCPLYRVTYVYVYDYTPTRICVGYLPGYLGLYVWPRFGVVVYGAGYWYPGYVRGGIWFGWPLTFGLGVAYHPYVGGFVYGARYYTPLAYRPLRASWYPFTTRYHERYHMSNVYARWGSGVIHAYDTWRGRSHVTGVRGPLPGFGAGSARRPIVRPTSPASAAGVRRHSLFVGRDGRIYRRSAGGWERRDGRTWRPVSTRRSTQTPSPRAAPSQTTRGRASIPSGLERDARSRRVGTERARAYQSWRRRSPALTRPVRPSPRSRDPRATRPAPRGARPPSVGRSAPAPSRSSGGGGTTRRGGRSGR